MKQWLNYFEHNHRHRDDIAWESPIQITQNLIAPLISSLRKFQVGESGEGRHLRKQAATTQESRQSSSSSFAKRFGVRRIPALFHFFPFVRKPTKRQSKAPEDGALQTLRKFSIAPQALRSLPFLLWLRRCGGKIWRVVDSPVGLTLSRPVLPAICKLHK